MKGFLTALRSYDWFLISSIALLALIGLVVLYGISVHQTRAITLFHKQALFIALSIAAMVLGGLFDYRIFRNWGWAALLAYGLVIALLIAVLLFGVTVRGAKSWFIVGTFGLQPVEFAKIVLILVLAKYLAGSHIEIHRIRHIVISGLYVIIPTLLILAQPDLGSVVVLFVLWVGMLLIAGIRWRHMAALALLAIVVAVLGWLYALAPYQKDRIISFLNPTEDIRGVGYNRTQALIAIGSGGLFGRGIAHATQTQFGFLPEASSDFILAAIGEIWGAAGLGIVVLLWAIIFWRLKVIAERTENNFARLFIAGFFIIAMMEFFINAAVNFGLLPITGIPSPFVSYGGSSLLAFSLGVGLILSIARISKK